LPILAGRHFLLGRPGVSRLIFASPIFVSPIFVSPGKGHTRPSQHGAALIKHRSADASGNFLIGTSWFPAGWLGKRRGRFLSGLSEAGRRATQSEKCKNYDSGLKAEIHE
jgi:hypothetical protein